MKNSHLVLCQCSPFVIPGFEIFTENCPHFSVFRLIEQRAVGSDEVLRFEVSGEKIEAVHMLPGYTHNIINLSDKGNAVFSFGKYDKYVEYNFLAKELSGISGIRSVFG